MLVDHCEEHTFPLVKEAGYWAGLTLYPTSKLNPKRAADILELYGMDRVWANSAADWGDSDPLALTGPGLRAAQARFFPAGNGTSSPGKSGDIHGTVPEVPESVVPLIPPAARRRVRPLYSPSGKKTVRTAPRMTAASSRRPSLPIPSNRNSSGVRM